MGAELIGLLYHGYWGSGIVGLGWEDLVVVLVSVRLCGDRI